MCMKQKRETDATILLYDVYRPLPPFSHYIQTTYTLILGKPRKEKRGAGEDGNLNEIAIYVLFLSFQFIK